MPFSKSVRIFLASVLLCVNSASADHSTATLGLQRYLLTLDFDYTDVSLQKVKDFIAQGADPHAISETGGNSFHIALEGFAYLTASSDQTKIEAAKDIVFYLGGLAVDTSLPDYRQLTPIYLLLRYGLPSQSTNEVFEFLLKNKMNLESTTTENWGLVHLLSTGGMKTQFTKLLDLGLNLERVTAQGLAFSHRSAAVKPKAGEALFLETLMSRLPPNRQIHFANIAASDGSRPIHFAVRRKNFAAVQYLVQNFHVDVNASTQEGDTPLSIALANQDQPLAQYLQSVGAVGPAPASSNISCNPKNPNRFSLDYEKLVEVIETCKIKSINHLLPLLPPAIRSNYITAYSTLAVQDASPDFPQAVLYGRDGKLLLALNGHKSQRGYNNLEVIQFRDHSKQFELRDIEFPKNKSHKVKYSAVNPVKCLACHGTSPRPLWDSWTLWPGKFNGETESNFPLERPFYARYLKNRNKGRYQYLLPHTFGPLSTPYGSIDNGQNQNVKLDTLLDGLMPQKVTRDISNILGPNSPYRYAFLAALSCQEPLDAFLPGPVASQFKLSFNFTYQETWLGSNNEMKERIRLHETFLQGPASARYVVQEKFWPNSFQSNQAGRNFDIDRTARIRYLSENLGIPTANWFTPFAMGKPSYSVQLLSSWEYWLWTELLDSGVDSDLYQEYQQKRDAQTGTGSLPGNLFYQTPQEANLCGVLKMRSLAALN